jgi:DNA polymerase/3'-5' exonuclease PolX
MKLGLNLSDHGATPKMEKGVIWNKPIPTCLKEEDIFKFLDMEYKTPQQRDL